ncbi:rhomboid family intramembrane serine protease [Neobacillus notoginsengisoli]|uniref:Rhomboid family intramembrane serine protease n=1 Tax=Neobacillus notoginsengisoli TaxID=1578198 RepID=A0A417YUT8_9BACI|nr:rhomboid family intramembrane serine protease [Neobacillus notoginsengisoli]RHW41064.1 rhomboid family intramembrane serine protease [Neobacillus notoginsengisoli]
MYKKEDYVFWKLAELFIVQAGYRIVKLFPNQQELWLEKKENKKTPIVRLLRSDISWSNWMVRDIETTALTGSRIRRQMNLRRLPLVNIYISEYPPVDDYATMAEEPFILRDRMSETLVHSILFAEDTYKDAEQKLAYLTVLKDLDFLHTLDYSQEAIEEVKRKTLEHARRETEKEQAIFKAGKPFFTYIFMAIQIAVFLILELNGGSTNPSTLLKFGAKFNPLILNGEWWRFFTPIFLHIGLLHLAMNTFGLYFVGTAVERMMGSARFLFVYLFAGFGGSLASFLFSHELSAGASGAIFGCLGALLYFGLVFPRLFYRTMGPTVLFIIVLNLAFGFSVSMVDNAGHIGGLAAGFLAAGIVHFPKKKRPVMQIAFAAASILIVGLLLQHGFQKALGPKDERSVILLAEEYINQENIDKAYEILKAFETNSSVTEKTYFMLSFTEIKKGMLPEAKLHLQKAIELDPEFPEAHYNLALIYLEEENLELAGKHAEKAAAIKPGRDEYKNLVAEIKKAIKKNPRR